MKKVGIPRALLYYKYFPLWKAFFSSLGVETVISPKTNREILDQGSKYVVDETCLPVKVFFGHVNYLKDKVDYIFAPRIVSIVKKEYTCPKFMGVPDILKANIDDLPDIIGPTIDVTKQDKNIYKKYWEVGRKLNLSTWKISKAWKYGLKEMNRYKQNWLQGKFPDELGIKFKNSEQLLKIAVIGHEYIIYDPYISLNLLQKLVDMNVRIVTIDMLPDDIINKEIKGFPKKMFWEFARTSLGFVFYFSKQKDIDGFINISSFGCGPDSMVSSMINHYLKNNCNKPFLNLTIDEHTGEAGLNTRIEAFCDLLRRRVG